MLNQPVVRSIAVMTARLLLGLLVLFPGGAWAVGPQAYITNSADSTVSVIDTASNTVVATVPVVNPQGVAVNPAGAFAYVTSLDRVSVIDTASNTVVATVPVGALPTGIALDRAGTVAVVANFGTVSVIDTATNTVVGTVFGTGSSNQSPIGVAVNPAGTLAYVTNPNRSIVDVIDIANRAFPIGVASVDVVAAPSGVAINQAGTLVYVACENTSTVSVIDTASNTVVATVPVGLRPQGIAVNPAGTLVYVTNFVSNTVSVINTASNTVVATVPVGLTPRGVAVNPAGTFTYVANFFSNTVSVIDTASNTVVATVPVGNFPFAFGQFIGGRTSQQLVIKHPQMNDSLPLVQNDFLSTNDVIFEADDPVNSGHVDWSVLIEYQTSGGRGAFQTTDTFHGDLNATSTTRTFTSEGGRLTINATEPTNSGGRTADPIKFAYVVGSAIPDAEITARLVSLYNGATPNLLTGIAVVESSYKQFSSRTLFGFSGLWPIESPDGGSHIGLLQLPVNKSHAWDWHANTTDGANLFADKIRAARSLERRIRKQTPNLPRLTDVQIENMALVLYGPFADPRLNMQYYIPQVTGNTAQWIENTVNNPDGVNYADTVRSSVR